MTQRAETREIVRGLPKPARERLKRHVCWLCEIRLDRGYCSSIGHQCSRSVMLTRIADCLAAGRNAEAKKAADQIYEKAIETREEQER